MPRANEKPVAEALADFVPKSGQRFVSAQYEKSKAALQSALFASGYLDAAPTSHRVDVSRSANRASIVLKWDVGARYRFGDVVFKGSQLDDGFLDRYVPWREGDFYSQTKLLRLQQQLIDADYFGIVDVMPDKEHAHDGVIPIKVTLAPAKRNIYTAGVFVDSDIGVGVKGGLTRRWVNARGHKAKIEVQIAQRAKTLSGTYTIPLPGDDNRAYNFGAIYSDLNTQTAQSNTTRLVANETRQWLGFTRTLGLNVLTGNFTVANIDGNSTLLYPEISLEKKRADDPQLRARRLFDHARCARQPGPAVEHEIRPGARRRKMDTRHRQQPARDPARFARRHRRRRFRQAAAGTAFLRRRRPVDPRLCLRDHRLAAAGESAADRTGALRIESGHRLQQPDHRRQESRRRQRRVRVLLHPELGHRDLCRHAAMHSTSSAVSRPTSAPASACAGARRSAWCARISAYR